MAELEYENNKIFADLTVSYFALRQPQNALRSRELTRHGYSIKQVMASTCKTLLSGRLDVPGLTGC